MSTKATAIIQQYAPSRAEVQGACRFFNNAALCPGISFAALADDCRLVVNDKTVLLIEDTSSIQRSHMRGLHAVDDPDLGPTEKKDLLGFFVHPVLVIEGATGLPLGIAAGHIWNRRAPEQGTTAAKDAYKKKPLAEKESARWIDCARASLHLTEAASHRIVVADREADIYDLYALVSEASVTNLSGRSDVLIRAKSDRNGITEAGMEHIFETVAKSEVLYGVRCETRTKSGKRRWATCEVRCTKVELQRPARANKDLPAQLSCWVLEAKEIVPAEGLAEGEEPILWRILTTLPITTAAEAEQALRWYCRRWQIEQLFRLLKREGLRVEDSQLERGIALKNLVVFALAVALKLLQATTARDLPNTIAPEFLFTEDEQQCAEMLIPRYEGKTDAQKNSYPKKTLLRYLWLVARLGGWKGYQRESPPGPITMRRGFQQLTQMLELWTIFKEQSP